MITIDVQGKIEVYPIVATGERWPVRHEGSQPRHPTHDLFLAWPELEGDQRYSDYGNCPDVADNPPPGCFGGGLHPSLARTPGGKLLCAFRTGAAHKNTPGAQISLSVSEDRGKTWSPYRVVVQGAEDCDFRNQALGVYDEQTIVLTYGLYSSQGRSMVSICSCDGGRTWSPPNEIDTGEIVPWLHPHGQIIRVSDGMVFVARGAYPPQHLAADANLPPREAYLCWSRDEGKSFSELIHLGARSETSLLPLDDERWICYCRMNKARPRVGWSFDGGRTWPKWGEAYPDVNDEDMERYAAPGCLVKLPSGNILLTHTFRQRPFGIRAVLSTDGGDSFDWDRQYVLEDSFWAWDAGYPSTVCFEDGTLVTTGYAILDMDHPEWGTCALSYVYDEGIFG